MSSRVVSLNRGSGLWWGTGLSGLLQLFLALSFGGGSRLEAQTTESLLEVRGQVTWSSTFVDEGWGIRDELTVSANVVTHFRVYLDADGILEDLVEEGLQEWSASASGGGSIVVEGLDPVSWTYTGCDAVGIQSFFAWDSDRALYLGFSDPCVWKDSQEDCEPTALCDTLNSLWWEGGKGKLTFAPGDRSLVAEVSGAVDFEENPWPGVTQAGRMHASFSASAVGLQPEMEVVIIPPPGFDDWLPQAGANEQDAGNGFDVRIEIRPKDPGNSTAAEGVFHVELVDTSRERGICLNAPPEGKALEEYDLRIVASDPNEMNVDDEGQWADTISKAVSCVVHISSYDFGAFGGLQAHATINGREYPAHVEGQPGAAVLSIPKDQDGDHIADAWEKQKGVSELGADWEGANIPANQRMDGDGVSLFERYRGFKFRGHHERLEPKEKYVFVYDQDNLVLLSLVPDGDIGSFIAASKCRVRTLCNEEWTGRGSYGAAKRIVNFNSGWGHVADQHALDVRAIKEVTPLDPADFRAVIKLKYGTASTGVTKITTKGACWGDFTSPYMFACPGGAYMITIYLSHIRHLLRELVEYHTQALPKFHPSATSGMSAEQIAQWQAELAAEVDGYIDANREDFDRAVYLHTVRTVTHEMGHGIGIDDLTGPLGPKECFMRYIGSDDFLPDANDRLEKARRKWPNVFCTSTLGTKAGVSCWGQIRVTDNEDK